MNASGSVIRTIGSDDQADSTEQSEAAASEFPTAFRTGPRHELQPRIRGSLSLTEVSVLYICALVVETNAVIATLDEKYEDVINFENNLYLTCGVLAGVKIAILSLTNAGVARSAIDTQHVSWIIKSKFSRSIFIIATGICAGVGYNKESDGEVKDVFLGDVIISTKVRRYAHGLSQDGSLYSSREDRDTIPDANQELRNKLHYFELGDNAYYFGLKVMSSLECVRSMDDGGAFAYFRGGRPETRPPSTSDDRLYNAEYLHMHRKPCKNGCDPDTGRACEAARNLPCRNTGCDDQHLERVPPASRHVPPQIILGTYGSGDLVLRSPNTRDQLFEQGIVAVEMEGLGIWQAGLESKHTVVIIKGVSDYADSHKNNDWQRYAATTAACVAKEFVRQFFKLSSEVPITMQSERLSAIPEQTPSAPDYSRPTKAFPTMPRRTRKCLGPCDYTVAWLCSNLATDLKTAMCMLDEEHLKPTQYLHTSSVYKFGAIAVHGHTACRNIVIVCVGDQQNEVAATRDIVRTLQQQFPNLETYLSVGTGAGIPCSPPLVNPEQDVHLGDVVVGSPKNGHPAIVSCGPTRGPPAPSSLSRLPRPSGHMLAILADLVGDELTEDVHLEKSLRRLEVNKGVGRLHSGTDKLHRADFMCTEAANGDFCQCDEALLEDRPPRPRTGKDLIYHQGTILCRDPTTSTVHRDDLASAHPEALCIETAVAGLSDDIQILVIRGISHYAGSNTNELWSNYASGTAAAFTRELVKRMGLPRDIERRRHTVERTYTFDVLLGNVKDSYCDYPGTGASYWERMTVTGMAMYEQIFEFCADKRGMVHKDDLKQCLPEGDAQVQLSESWREVSKGQEPPSLGHGMSLAVIYMVHLRYWHQVHKTNLRIANGREGKIQRGILRRFHLWIPCNCGDRLCPCLWSFVKKSGICRNPSALCLAYISRARLGDTIEGYGTSDFEELRNKWENTAVP